MLVRATINVERAVGPEGSGWSDFGVTVSGSVGLGPESYVLGPMEVEDGGPFNLIHDVWDLTETERDRAADALIAASLSAATRSAP